MSNNCLVTKLKGVVQNDDLPILNTITLRIDTQDNPGGQVLRFSYSGSNVTVDTDGHPMYDSTHFSKGTYKVKVSPKQNITSLTLGEQVRFKTSDLLYLTNVTQLLLYDGGLEPADIKEMNSLTSLSIITTSGKIFSGDIGVLESGPLNLERFEMVWNRDLTGNVAALKHMTNMVLLNTLETNIYGDIEDVCSYWSEQGKESSCQLRKTDLIHLNGAVFPNVIWYVKTEDGCKLTLNNVSGTTLATYNNTTHQWTYS